MLSEESELVGDISFAYATEGGVEERLLRATAEYVRFARERPHEFRILLNPPNELETLERIAELTREQNGKLTGLLREAVAGGTMRVDLEVQRVTTTIRATPNGLPALSWRADSLRVGEEELDTLVETYLATISDGLRK
ncbi:TetR family transcriptional regulator C-terminal domain-containing protein [Nocardia sp. NPDC059764]|uniref:TetR family transcriptional regulator C-terminal domain-containing protein n=1 Tax=Nocardia sp. NPDC059764 TaxID=3346939 RepID=UPI003648DEDF